jgi:hypothetical protein
MGESGGPAAHREYHPVIVSALQIEGAFGRFADRLLAIELPDLPAPRRAETVGFVCKRANQVPTPLRLGVTTLSIATGLCERLVGGDRTTRLLRSTSLPFVGELARMVRSLGFAFVWESWPDTSPSGAASAGAPV